MVIDFIGNYNNNYLIPVALYGNTGDRDRARKNLQRKSIGLSSISFDPIAKERILKSLDTADWSDMKKLSEQYRQVRYELGRIPMLTDIYNYDPHCRIPSHRSAATILISCVPVKKARAKANIMKRHLRISWSR